MANAFLKDQKVKYFGRVIPPKCELRGCFLSDDGEHFYCTNFSCNKHRSRRTKHTRYSRYGHLDATRREARAPGAAETRQVNVQFGTADSKPYHGFWPLMHYKCPECGGSDVQMRLLQNHYECGECQYTWR